MSEIAGIWAWSGPLAADDACREMAADFTSGGDRCDLAASGPVTFARNLRKLLPEDDFDEQPLRGAGGRYLLVADVRLDNRFELLAALGQDRAQGQRMSDCALLLAAWEKWQESCLDQLLGDYAFVLWDSVEGSLRLVRAPMAMKPLFYQHNSQFFAVASSPTAFHRLAGNDTAPNLAFAAAMAAGIHPKDGSTIYSGIQRVRHGHILEVGDGLVRDRRFWSIREGTSRFSDPRDYGLGLRAELDRAVGAQLRTCGAVGAHLSAGRDSAAVAGTAAIQLAPSTLFAFTGAPRSGYPERHSRWRIGDESRLAAETAALHPTMRHIVCRRTQRPLFALVGEAHLLQQEPLPNLTNLPWWWAIDSRAEELGVTAMLGATAGNFTISASGERHIVDLVRLGRIGQWLRVARGLRQIGYVGWPFLLHNSFGPWLPKWLHGAMMRASGRAYMFQKDASLLSREHRGTVEQRFADELSDVRPARSHYAFRRKMLYDWLFSDRLSLARFGVDFRDPTSDRRLIDFCLSLPVDALAAPQSSRPAYDTAFEDRVPQSIRSLRMRGYQGADWHEMTSSGELLQLIDHYWQSPSVDALFDRSAVRKLAELWPTAPCQDENDAHLFRDQLMNAMGMANFIAVTFDGLPALPEAFA